MRILNKDPGSVTTKKPAFLYDALALAPVRKPDTNKAAIRRRVTLLRLSDWDPLSAEPSPCSSGRTADSLPTYADPNRAGPYEDWKQARGLSRPARSRTPHFPNARGTDCGFQEAQPRGGAPLASAATGESIVMRRPLSPPSGPAPTPTQFTFDCMRSKPGKANKAGELSGTGRLILVPWSHKDGELPQLTFRRLSFMAAGNVPAAIVGLLTSDRGWPFPGTR